MAVIDARFGAPKIINAYKYQIYLFLFGVHIVSMAPSAYIYAGGSQVIK
jgi:hypothetical protein